MVKLTGPLHSETARGSVGEALTYSNRKSGAQVRFQKKQKDVITTLRTAQRVKFQLARDWWLMLNDSEKQQWNQLTK